MLEKYKVYKLSDGRLLVKNIETKSTKMFSNLIDAEKYIEKEIGEDVSFRFYRKENKLFDSLGVDSPQDVIKKHCNEYILSKAKYVLSKFYDNKNGNYIIASENLSNLIILSILDLLYLDSSFVLLEVSDCVELNDITYILSSGFDSYDIKDFSEDLELVKSRYKAFGYTLQENMEFSYDTYSQDSYGALIDDILLSRQQDLGLIVTRTRNLKLVKIVDIWS